MLFKNILLHTNQLTSPRKMLLLSFAGSMLFNLSSVYASLADTIETTKPGIVGIGTFQMTRIPQAKLLGTGFVVGNGQYIVTNSHVVPEAVNEEVREFLAIFIGKGKKTRHLTAELIKRDRIHDLALLKITKTQLHSLSLGSIEKVREGDLLAFTGFPIGAVLGLYPVTHRGIVSAISPIVIPVSSSTQLSAMMIKRLRNPYNVLQLDATAYPGNSGSPLYNTESGLIVGVINKVFVKETKEKVLEKPSGITYAIPVNHVKDLLKAAGVKFK